MHHDWLDIGAPIAIIDIGEKRSCITSFHITVPRVFLHNITKGDIISL